MLLRLRDEIAESVNDALATLEIDHRIQPDRVDIEEFGDDQKGEFSTAVAFELAGQLGRPPHDIAAELAETQTGLPAVVESIETIDGYVNYHLSEPAFLHQTLTRITSQGTSYGRHSRTDPDRIVADVSSPNIAKPMHVGHLRNTILGDALLNVLEARGHEVLRDNHLGDWGVPFAGALLHEFTEHGSETELDERGIEHLLELYQQYKQRETDREHHEQQARQWFRRVERGDERARDLWERFREISIADFENTYDRLGVSFDLWLGESFYALNGWNDRVIERAREESIAVETDDGAVFVPIYPADADGVEHPDTADVDSSLDRANAHLDALGESELDDPERDVSPAMEPFYIVKSDGSTVYGTRDLATIEYRAEELDADRSIYVVASEQDQYFQQLFVAARKFGHDELGFEHVSYGLVPGMSTRDGNIVRVTDLLDEARDHAREIVREKNPSLSDEQTETVSEQVGLGTIKYQMVSLSRQKDLHFDMAEAVSLETGTGPYLQYQTTRTHGILDRVDEVPAPEAVEPAAFDETERELLATLARYPMVLEACEDKYDPAPLANYLDRVAREFSAFYANNRVIENGEPRPERVVLTDVTRQVLENGLDLLGIEALEQM